MYFIFITIQTGLSTPEIQVPESGLPTTFSIQQPERKIIYNKITDLRTYGVPQPGPPLGPLGVAEVLLRRLLQHLPLLLQLPVLLALQDVHLRVVLEGTAGLHGQLVHPPVHDVLLEDQGAAALRGVETVGPVHVEDSGEVIRVLSS